jgi:glycosyltransferase involved in cell wall biosynthesis
VTDRTIIVMPAYNAERTLERIVTEVPAGIADEILVVDDASSDRTAEIAARLPVHLLRHPANRGYGANQKTCYDAALARGADRVVMLHPDDQYDARLIPAALDVLRLGVLDVVLGNRIRTRAEALAGGMPKVKYLANRGLTLIENVLAGQNLGEWHSGFRAYRREVLETIPYGCNDDGFAFDSQFLLQAVHFGFRLGDVPMPVRYVEGMSTIGLGAATAYAWRTLWTFAVWYGHRLGIARSPLFLPREPAAAGAALGPSAGEAP